MEKTQLLKMHYLQTTVKFTEQLIRHLYLEKQKYVKELLLKTQSFYKVALLMKMLI